MKSHILALTASIAAGSLVGCSAGGGAPTTTGTVVPHGVRRAVASPNFIYVTDYGLHELLVYPAAASNPAPVRTQPLTGGIGVATDSTGLVYVAASSTSVDVFSSGAATLLRTITGLGNPQGLAVDSSDNLYVANSDPNTLRQEVSVFSPGASTPFRVVYVQGSSDVAEGVSVDAGGDLFIHTQHLPDAACALSSEIQEALPGQSQASKVVCAGQPGGLAVDPGGNLDSAEIGDVVQYVPPAWSRSVIKSYGANHDVGFLSFFSDGSLYVPVYSTLGDEKVWIYPTGSFIGGRYISQGLQHPLGAAAGI